MLLRANDRLVLLVSIVLCLCRYSIHAIPRLTGTHPPVMHLTSLESHHPQDRCGALSLVATAHGSATASTLDLLTERKYL